MKPIEAPASAESDSGTTEPKTWVTFTPSWPAEPSPLAVHGGARVDAFRVREVRVRRGAPPRLVAGARLLRLEGPAPWPSTRPDHDLVGVLQHHTYASASEGRRIRDAERREAGALAVLVPVTKSPDWWQLGQDQRLALLRGSKHRQGHLAVGMEHASRVLRRLYHARYLPGSTWDFLAYFEFGASDEPHFNQLLAALRDPDRSAEWQFVDRECEIWLERQRL